MNTKPWYKSKELWLAIIGIANTVSKSLGGPGVEPTPELVSAWIGLIGAVRLFFTRTKLSLK